MATRRRRNGVWRDAYAALIVNAVRSGASYRHIGDALYVAPNTVVRWTIKHNFLHLVHAARRELYEEAAAHLRNAVAYARADPTFSARASVFRHPAVRRALIAIVCRGAPLSVVVQMCGFRATSPYHAFDEETMRALANARRWRDQEAVRYVKLMRERYDDAA